MSTVKGELLGSTAWGVGVQAQLDVGLHGVRFTAEDGKVFYIPWGQLSCKRGGLDNLLVVLEGTAESGEKLEFQTKDESAVKELRATCPPTLGPQLDALEKSRVSQARVHTFVTAKLLVSIVAFVGLFYLVLEGMLALTIAFFPVEWEVQLGKIVAAGEKSDIEKGAVFDAVNGVWDRVRPNLEPNPYQFHIYIVRNPVVNAYASPGGTIVVFTGLLRKVQSPEELAGVLGHEATHVIKRHSLKSLVRGVELGVVLSLFFGNTADSLQKLGSRIDGLAYSRSHESQADAESLKALLRAHVDPQGFIGFFDRLLEEEQKHGGAPMPLLSTHPPSLQRKADLEKLLSEQPPVKYDPIPVNWKAVQHELEGGEP